MQEDEPCQSLLSAAQDRTDTLKSEIRQLEAELAVILQRCSALETLLRTHLINEIIEEQELSVLYKQKQRAKKENRQEQKRKGKNFKEHSLPQRPKNIPPHIAEAEEPELRKRLYREAMVQVHPDKYANHADTVNLASEATVRLIELYRNGTLTDLRNYCAYIMSGMALNQPPSANAPGHRTPDPEAFLRAEAARITKLIAEAKNRHIYKVLEHYSDPMVYLAELHAFYQDRLAKLRKRTKKMPREESV